LIARSLTSVRGFTLRFEIDRFSARLW